MDSEYDKKFEEMKQYIPFLEKMIKRLENTSTESANPRQAQLDKIRSLRDLLLDKKKRMKMDNLLKCELVLINLYAKVEQGDTLPGIKPASEAIPPGDNMDLNIARNKLKTVAAKSHHPDTLPEIARATETEVGCSGSKEPALFQRRPNIGSLSPTKKPSSDKSPYKSNSKRSYTRVLQSPDRGDRQRFWSPSEGPQHEENLYCRRSPQRLSRRHSPSYHKRERKKSSKESHSRKSQKDLNITLKVPEERLNSLNTKDILSRIINCSERDVDIATLRELRTQILGELKQTGANEDISDLILKSYKNKKNKKSKNKAVNDVEEGELSDSESEAIENIYGNLVVVEKDKTKDASSSQNKSSSEQDQISRKIQICLVINSDKEETSSELSTNKNASDNQEICDLTDFEMFDDNSGTNPADPIKSKPPEPAYSTKNTEVKSASQKTIPSLSPVKTNVNNSTDIISINDVDLKKKENSKYTGHIIDMNEFDIQDNSKNVSSIEVSKASSEIVPFKVNFYNSNSADTTETKTTDSHKAEMTQSKSVELSTDKLSEPEEPLDRSEIAQPVSKDKTLESTGKPTERSQTDTKEVVSTNTPNTESIHKPDAEIPLLNEPTVQPAKKDIVSEIDILQALKNEILSDTISLPCAEAITPALHQPKVTKVANAQELPKKRITIENYKKKTIPSNKLSLFVKTPRISDSKKETMKQSLKLTEKEVERFNLISKIALDDDSDDEKDTDLKSLHDLDLAPKSPDMEITDDTPVSPPVIIPADPVKMAVVNSKTDVDMRQLPMMTANAMTQFAPSTPIQTRTDVNNEIRKPVDKPEVKRPVVPVDPRMRKDALLPTPPVAYPNMTPSRNSSVAPNMTPSRAPNMTPSRTPNMTPNARAFEFNPNRPFNADDSGSKHVYAPMFSVQDNLNDRKSVWEPSERSPVDTYREMSNAEREKNSSRWDDKYSKSNNLQKDEGSRYNDSNDMGYNRTRNDRGGRDDFHRQEGSHQSNYYSRSDCPSTPTPSFGRGDTPSTPSHYFGRSECPRTPSHPFGRSEPSNHSFGMSDPPRTPSHPFGRSEAPMTPSHPFGRSEAPLTPSHPFGRSEAPMTPSHPFGRSEAPMTPSHPFGRSDYSHMNPSSKYGKAHDPRLNRSYDNESNRRDTGSVSYNDRNRFHRNDPRNFNREQSVPRNEPKPYTPDQTYRRDQMTRREPSVGRSISGESDRERLYSRDRSRGLDNSKPYADVGSRRPFQRESSASRSVPDYRARASSVGRSVRNELSVESHAGRAFTIDTSVNSTFQKFLDSHRNNDISFDARRQRASSVGRSLTREPSVGRNMPSNSSHKTEDNNRNRFKRAQSVGRELSSSRTEKSFKDVKAEFESYRNNDRRWNKDPQPIKPKENTNSRDPRIRRESYDKQPTTNHGLNKTQGREAYEKMKTFNYRDPRQRKEQKQNERLSYQRDRKRGESRDRHSYGISSDSGTKTPVISSVKNYKIPKIKRPEPEPKPVEATKEVPNKTNDKKSSSVAVEKDMKQKAKVSHGPVKVDKKIKEDKNKTVQVTSKKTDDDKNSSTAKTDKKGDDEEKNNVTAKSEKRVMRRSGRKVEETQSSEPSEDEIVNTRPRRFKKVIYDSDSDETISKTNAPRKTASPKKSMAKPKIKSLESNKNDVNLEGNTETGAVKENSNKDQSVNKDIESEDYNDTLDTSFGLDGTDLFPDNIINDPVLDNINALIADLDNDLATPKAEVTCNDLFNDISIENMLEKMTSSPLKKETKKLVTVTPSTADTVKNDIFDALKTETNKITDSKLMTVANDKKEEILNKVNDDESISVTPKQIDSPSKSEVKSQTHDKSDLEPVVSTSVNEEESSKKDQSSESEKNQDGQSAPDSTNEAENTCHKHSKPILGKPDSTIEKQCEMNSDISSTHDAENQPIKENVEVPKEPTPQIDSIGSLLSILQDKSKIKALLSMLGDQPGENEKIKKKLEKLKEIVSDEEETNDDKIDEDNTSISFSNEKADVIPNKQDEKDMINKKSADDTILKEDQADTDKAEETESSKLTDTKPNLQSENENKEETTTEDSSKHDSEPIREGINSAEANRELEQIEESNDAENDRNSELEDNGEKEGTKGPYLKPFIKSRKKVIRKGKKRLKSGKFKKGKPVKRVSEEKRVTRSEAAGLLTKPKQKKPSRELRQLQESIKEMFVSDAILNATGIRMCRLAKMVDENSLKSDDQEPNESELCQPEPSKPEPRVVLEKFKHIEEKETELKEKPMRKKPGPKPKAKPAVISPHEKKNKEDEPLIKYKPGPKSKTKIPQIDNDPYDFETKSINESKSSEKALDSGSDSENESLASSFGSTELLVELKKKPKRKRGAWQSGVIKPKKKRKVESKSTQSPLPKPTSPPKRSYKIPDYESFTDKNYCFSKDTSEYQCRLCESTHSWKDIVFHYKKHHPHYEVPLSRMSPDIAREAIEQCGDVDFGAISKIPTDKYTCRFCFIEFGKKRAVLESFFWHVVSMHTGEYKQLCSECINVERCPFNLDIPPPPKDIKGQLIGYICGKCNYTQISLENLKMHVINRHNDTETEVYTINFAVMTKSTINSLLKRLSLESTPRTTRSTRSNQSMTEPSDDRSEVTESELETARPAKKTDVTAKEKTRRYSFNSKISFENDDNASDISNFANTESSVIKAEQDDDEDNQQDMDDTFAEDSAVPEEAGQIVNENRTVSNDIMNYPHFKISYTDSGNKEYVCCINGKDNHYKTGLLISMKKHVQLKHTEIWDGYCFVCKVIVTSQGEHKFSECLTHYLDSHIDNFPVLEKVVEPIEKPVTPSVTPEPVERAPTPYINVRPLAELVKPVEPAEEAPALPVIETVSILPAITPKVDPPRPSPTYPVLRKETEPPKEYKYEEAQAEVMSKKHRVVLDAMMTPEKLVQIFKCAGRFCSFTTDSAEEALLHASTHQRVGGTNALLCAYCDFDSSGNTIDLVSHVFKSHGKCRVVCALCFYRGAVSQLVAAHITRVHGTTPDRRCVLKSNYAPALCEPAEENMSRETAVPLYICKQSENEEPCMFKTVTYAKFWEHLTQTHANATGFICYVCNDSCADATALILHLKTHGLKLYHCTLCVHGADNELELLAHASAKHPGKNPQAYIRTILGTSGNGNYKILPLVELKKTALTPEEITPNQGKENPVKEAERSIELEKLIGHMLDMPATEPEKEPEPVTPISEVLPEENIVSEDISSLLEEPTSAAMATLIPVPPLLPLRVETPKTPPRPVTPAPAETNIAKQITPVLKEEPMDTTPEKNESEVICLDSDDEDSKQGIVNLSEGIINLSDDDKDPNDPQTSAGDNPAEMFKCQKCNKIAKSYAGFKKHMHSCWKQGEKVKCALCPLESDNLSAFLKHYNEIHNTPARLKCSFCPHTESTMYLIKKHVRVVHEIGSREAAFPTDSQYVLGKRDTGKPKPVKRKSSGTTSGPPSKQKRYGPSDIDKLPINPILEESVFCDICGFNTKVRLNMVRHLLQHASQQPVAQTAPVNPVPHLETNEFHFDRMVNLASSSIATRAPEKPQKEPTPTFMIPQDKASRLPQFVPERYRYTCGANGCTYISVDEAMLKCHWETLHSGTNDYHCVHCPPHQFLDKSRPLTANRIIAHLKMHDIRLYACPVCPYYHYKRQVLDKHMVDAHKGGTALVVREESNPAPTTPTTAPTMDLKPWQCGLCKFKSMLRPEVAEHCSKMHQSKMQYKCAYCPFRTSTPENVTKHQTTSHPNRDPEIFYFYYREGSIPNDPDGMPHWQKQRQQTGLDTVKAEAEPPPVATDSILPAIQPPAAPPVNLNLVKQEIDPDAPMEDSVEELCTKYGEFCEPNGLNYKCSLCNVVVEDSKQAMQSHLFEELHYRKWGCRLCSYKAFHQTGLKEHVWTEHNRHNVEPLELALDLNIESWVSKQLDYQEDLIKKNRDKLAQQKMQDERPVAPTTSKTVEVQTTSKLSMEKLEKIFGSLGVPSNMQYCCPKCLFKTGDDKIIQEHLEAELTRIRWCCSNCPNHFSTYHEAQFHGKSVHAGLNARPLEAARDPALRAAWVAAVVRVQKLSMNCMPVTVPAEPPTEDANDDDNENSLLVIRYEEDVPMPEEEARRRRASESSEDESLVIDEQAAKKAPSQTKCDHCDFTTKYNHVLEAHVLRHYNLKPFTCAYCSFNNYYKPVLQHMNTLHSDKPQVVPNKTEKQSGPPLNLNLTKPGKKPAPKKPEDANLVCLICELLLTEEESKTHVHDQNVPVFARRGDIVVKCSECLRLFLDVVYMQQHFTLAHPELPINYAYYKTDHDSRSFVFCSYCNQRFSYLIDLKTHHNQVHSSLKLRYTKTFAPGTSESESAIKAL